MPQGGAVFDPFQLFFGPGMAAGQQGGFGVPPGGMMHGNPFIPFGGAGFGAPAAPQEEQRTGPPPTSAAMLRLLPKIKVTQHDIEKNESTECVICLDDLVVNEPATRIPCGHLFHDNCVKDWLKKSNECPVCRYELPTDDAKYEVTRRQRMAGRRPRLRLADLSVKSAQELRRLADYLQVSCVGCLEKTELVELLAKSGKIEIISDEGSVSPTDAAAASTSSSTGPPVLFSCSPEELKSISLAELQAMNITRVKAEMDQVGVDYDDCRDKSDMINRLVLSGRINLLPDPVGEPSTGCSSSGANAWLDTEVDPATLR